MSEREQAETTKPDAEAAPVLSDEEQIQAGADVEEAEAEGRERPEPLWSLDLSDVPEEQRPVIEAKLKEAKRRYDKSLKEVRGERATLEQQQTDAEWALNLHKLAATDPTQAIGFLDYVREQLQSQAQGQGAVTAEDLEAMTPTEQALQRQIQALKQEVSQLTGTVGQTNAEGDKTALDRVLSTVERHHQTQATNQEFDKDVVSEEMDAVCDEFGIDPDTVPRRAYATLANLAYQRVYGTGTRTRQTVSQAEKTAATRIPGLSGTKGFNPRTATTEERLAYEAAKRGIPL